MSPQWPRCVGTERVGHEQKTTNRKQRKCRDPTGSGVHVFLAFLDYVFVFVFVLGEFGLGQCFGGETSAMCVSSTTKFSKQQQNNNKSITQ